MDPLIYNDLNIVPLTQKAIVSLDHGIHDVEDAIAGVFQLILVDDPCAANTEDLEVSVNEQVQKWEQAL